MQRKWRRAWERGKPQYMKNQLVAKTKRTASIPLKLAKKLLPPAAAASLLLATMTGAYANPSGGQVTSGTGTIVQNGNTMTITQNTGKMSINWQNFSIGSGETVNFVQPGASAIALNRVVGNNASNIYGQLNANGQVFLINPNGVLFAPGAQVNVGGLAASTLNLADSDFQAGKYTFSGNGGSVINQGNITAANGGYVALLGGQVSNQGIVVAKQGTAALGAGSAVTLDMNGDGLLSMAVSQPALSALAENKNLIKADGGTVIMTAKAADTLAGTVVNNGGIILAHSINNVNGVIRLDGGTNGTVINSGVLDAAGKDAGQTGGTVKVLGSTVSLSAGSNIDVSGDTGGGTALIGGNFHGAGPEQNAKNTTVATGSSINADAVTSGSGGIVAVWSDANTAFNGSISARGGAASGNGGQVETSGKTLKIGRNAAVNTLAPKGTAGNWLLDPVDITIGNKGYWNDPSGIDVDSVALTNALNSTNVTIETTGTSANYSGVSGGTGTSGQGDIIILDPIGAVYDYSNGGVPINWVSGATLKLSAYHNIRFKTTMGYYSDAAGGSSDVGGAIEADGPGHVILRADNSGTGVGTVLFDNSIYNTIWLGGGTAKIYYNPISYSYPTNYSLFLLSGSTGTLTAYMAVNAAISIHSKTYDGMTNAIIDSIGTLLTLPSGVTLNTSGAVASFSDKNVGITKPVYVGGITFSDGSMETTVGGQNYYLNAFGSATGTITAKSIHVTGISASSKTYDGSSIATLTGSAGLLSTDIIGSDAVSVAGSGTGAFADANAGSGKAVTVSGYSLTGSDAGNYSIVYSTGLTATINKADLILSGSRTYDGTTAIAGSALTATGVHGETFTVIGSGDNSNLSSKNVQTGSILNNITGLSLGSSSNGGLAANYNALSTAGSSVSITKANLTLSGSRTYDGTTAVAGSVLTAVGVNGETFTVTGAGDSSNLTNKNVQTGSTLNSVTGLSRGSSSNGGLSFNYNALSTTGSSISITKANLTLSGSRTYDGTTAVAGSVLTAVGVNGETFTVTGLGDTSNLSSKNVQTSSILNNITGLSLGSSSNGGLASNYNALSTAGSSVSVTKANLILSGSRAYDGTTAVAGSVLTAGGVNGETFTVAGVGDSSNLVSKNVQTGSMLSSVIGLSLGSSSNGGVASNYNALSTTGSSVSITKANLILSGSRAYDGTTAVAGSVLTAGGVNGETFTVTGAGDTSNLTSENVQTGSVLNNLTGLSLGSSSNGGLASNYNVLSTAGSSVSITKANLTLSGSRTYDGTTSIAGSALTATGVNGETFTVSGSGDNSNLAIRNVQTGSTLSSVTGLSLGSSSNGGLTGNYNALSTTGSSVSIIKANLTLSGSRTYDGTTAVAGSVLTATGVHGETFTVTGSGDNSNLASKNVQTGSTLSSVIGLSLGSSSNGGVASNYNALSTTGSSISITAKALTLSGITAANKVYDGTTSATLDTTGISYSGLVSGDAVTLSGTGVGTFTTKNVGTGKAVTLTGYTLGGTDAGNYTVSQPTGLTANITQADLTVTGISASNKTYNGNTGATLTGTAAVLGLGSDIVSVTGTGTGTFADQNAGTNKAVTVTGYSLTGTDASNYNIVQPTGVTATINKANLALSGSRAYDGTTSIAGSALTATGVNGETFTVSGSGDNSNLVSKNVQTGATLNSVTGLSLGSSSNGGLTSNYNALSTTGSSISITAKALTLGGITAANKVYDGTTAATLDTTGISYSGLVSGDAVTLSGTGIGTFIDKNVGIGKTVIVTGYTLGGADAGNYTFASMAHATANINPALLTVTANNAGKTYDGVAYSGGNGVSYSGFVHGETSSVLGGGITYGGTSQGAVDIGTYTIVPGGLISSNYNITYGDGILTVNPAGTSANPSQGTSYKGAVSTSAHMASNIQSGASAAGSNPAPNATNLTILPSVNGQINSGGIQPSPVTMPSNTASGQAANVLTLFPANGTTTSYTVVQTPDSITLAPSAGATDGIPSAAGALSVYGVSNGKQQSSGMYQMKSGKEGFSLSAVAQSASASSAIPEVPAQGIYAEIALNNGETGRYFVGVNGSTVIMRPENDGGKNYITQTDAAGNLPIAAAGILAVLRDLGVNPGSIQSVYIYKD